jgi:DNA polymerase III alpha subunit
VPIDETDSVRKAFTKKDISNKEKSLAQIKVLRDEFITKCKSTNGIDEKLSGEIFDDVEKFVSYSFNKAHAVSYATVSYQCAWFLTYYPDEWVATYIDYCITEKGKAKGKEDPKAVAIAEAKGLGYKFSRPDINKSGKDTEIENGSIIPSFESMKGVGAVAVQEINKFRPYTSIEDLLWMGDAWKHSKFNKGALETLVQLEALDSVGIIGPDKPLKNYKQLHYVIVENNDKLKRAISKKKKDHKEVLAQLIEEAQSLDDWNIEEKIIFSQELTGTIDIDLIVTQDVRDYFRKSGVDSIDKWVDEDEFYWAVVDSCQVKTTANGKKYLRMMIYSDSMENQMCNIWNYNERKDKIIPQNMLFLAKFKKNNFGLSCSYGQLEILERS